MKQQYVYSFEDGCASMYELLGRKGANLAEMRRIGLPVPPGFTITTEACRAYFANGQTFPDDLWEEVCVTFHKLLGQLAKNRIHGIYISPLFSCRSGARDSMPGMMDTILNIGLNDDTVKKLAAFTKNERFAYDSYRRLIQMYGSVVLGIDNTVFEHILTNAEEQRKSAHATSENMQKIVEKFCDTVMSFGYIIPHDPLDQLRLAINAVFQSWNSKRAIAYREKENIPHDLGTAVTVQTMVFGNIDNDSGTGVLMTRNGSTGEKLLNGKRILEGNFLLNAQGEDVVSGTRQVQQIESLAATMPDIYEQLLEMSELLEAHFHDVQDVEFTVQQGKVWLLQTRNAKRTARAAVRIAVDMVDEGLIGKKEAVLRVTPRQAEYFLHPQFSEEARDKARRANRMIAKGVAASPGAAVGHIVFDAQTAEHWANVLKKNVLLVRRETKQEDVRGMFAAIGILTARGGQTSHAGILARHFNKPAVVGCEALIIDEHTRELRIKGQIFLEGTTLSIDGATGEVFAAAMGTVIPDISDPYLFRLLEWADTFSRLKVWMNADNPHDALRGRKFGALGIGLCRTEHMFFQQERLAIVRRMILASKDKSSAEFKEALEELLPFQREDFEGIFRVMDGLPVIIRLLDPPLHEFLPDYEKLLVAITRCEEHSGADDVALARERELLAQIGSLREVNPMLGHRGVRLGITHPDITAMQIRAIMEAACKVGKEGIVVLPKIMIPLPIGAAEIKIQKDRVIIPTANAVMCEHGFRVPYSVGTMIEVPRAVLLADTIAKEAEFFSYGTNDLTQTTLGLSRDDAEQSFLPTYIEEGILQDNPFEILDEQGVGALMRIGVEKGRAARSDLNIGICGEHGGEPRSIAFCHRLDLNYVSCSPYRVPIARLAAAHAAIKDIS